MLSESLPWYYPRRGPCPSPLINEVVGDNGSGYKPHSIEPEEE